MKSDEPTLISCEDHEIVRSTEYAYLSSVECQTKHNTNLEFSASFDKVFGMIHKEIYKDCKEGQVQTRNENYAERGRTYGCYNLSAPSEWASKNAYICRRLRNGLTIVAPPLISNPT